MSQDGTSPKALRKGRFGSQAAFTISEVDVRNRTNSRHLLAENR